MNKYGEVKKGMNKAVKRIIAVIVSLGGFAMIALVLISENILYAVLGTVVLIIGVAIWNMSDQQSYNSSNDIGKMIEKTGGLSIEDVYRQVSRIDTPYGRAWLGKVKLLKTPCIIVGPGLDDSFVYIYKKHDNIYISQCISSFWLNVSEEELSKHRIAKTSEAHNSVKNSSGFSQDAAALINWFYEHISSMVKK